MSYDEYKIKKDAFEHGLVVGAGIIVVTLVVIWAICNIVLLSK